MTQRRPDTAYTTALATRRLACRSRSSARCSRAPSARKCSSNLSAEFADRARTRRRRQRPAAGSGGKRFRSTPVLLRWTWWRGWTGYEPRSSAFRPRGPIVKNWITDARYAARRLRNASRIRVARSAHARARNRRDRRDLRHRAAADLRSASLCECEQRRHVLDAGLVDGGRVSLPARQVHRLSRGRGVSTGRRDDPRWRRARPTHSGHSDIVGAVRRARRTRRCSVERCDRATTLAAPIPCPSSATDSGSSSAAHRRSSANASRSTANRERSSASCRASFWFPTPAFRSGTLSRSIRRDATAATRSPASSRRASTSRISTRRSAS